MSTAMSFISRLAGIERIETQIEAQNQATREHREWEGQALRGLKSEAEEIKELAVKTNGRVNSHDVELAVIKKTEDQAAIIQAAKVKAEAVITAKHLSWKQGIVFAICGAVMAGIVTTILIIAGVIAN